MHKTSSKIAQSAGLVAATLAAAVSSASADFVFNLSAPTVSGGYDTYVATVQNNGANGTGGNLLAVEGILQMVGPGYIQVDNTQDISGFTFLDGHETVTADGVNDINLPGINDSYGSNIGSFMQLGSSPLIFTDIENGVNNSGNFTWASSLNGSPNLNFNPAKFSTLTRLDLTEGFTTLTSLPDTTALPFFNIVVPHGSNFVLTCNAGNNTGGPTLNSPLFPVASLTPAALPAAGAAIVAGSAGSPSAPQGTFSTPTQTFSVAGGGGAYAPAFIRNISAGTNAANIQVSGFAPGDTEVFLLNLKTSGLALTLAQENTLVADLNAHANGLVASLVDPSLATIGGATNPWNIELTYTPPGTSNGLVDPSLATIGGATNSMDTELTNSSSSPLNGDFGFNFAGETNVSDVTVSDIAAVPEPASMGLLVVAGLGLLGHRRNKRVRH